MFLPVALLAVVAVSSPSVASDVFARWAPPGTVVTGDIEIADAYRDNPVRAEDWLRGHRVVLIGRVEEIWHSVKGFAVSVHARHLPGVGVRCEVPAKGRGSVAALHGGDLAVFTGRARIDGRHELHLDGCSPVFRFDSAEPAVVARSAERCLLEHVEKRGIAAPAKWAARVRADLPTRLLSCSLPALAVVVTCEHWHELPEDQRAGRALGPSCNRHQVLDVLNELVMDEETHQDEGGQTRAEAGKTIEPPAPQRSRLLGAAVSGGVLSGDEP
jgi:hypothetical protein